MPNDTDDSLVRKARELGPVVRAAADEIESTRCLPAGLVDELRSAGMFRMYLPREFGGTETDPLTLMAVVEEFGKADGSTAWCVNVANQGAWLASRLDSREAGGRIGPDSILSVSAVPPGRAVPEHGGFRVSGRWTFASGAPQATHLIGLATVNREGADPGTPPPAVQAVLPRSDFTVIDTWRTIGMRGTGSHDVEAHDVFVPQCLAPSSTAASVSANPLYSVPYMRFAGRGSLALGIARGAMDAFTALSKSKKSFGMQSTLSQQEHVQLAVAEAEANWGAAKAWLHSSTSGLWATLKSGASPAYQERAQFMLSVAHAAQASLNITQSIFTLGGSNSVKTTWSLERSLRDVQTLMADVSVGRSIVAAAGRAYLDEGPPMPLL